MKKIESTLLNHKYRGKTSSKKQNQFNLNVYRDILRHYEKLSELEKLGFSNLIISMASGESMSRSISKIEDTMNQLEQRIKSIEESKKRVIYSSYAKDMTIVFPNQVQEEEVKETRADILDDSRLVQPQRTHIIPKTYIKKGDGTHFIPRELEVDVERLGTNSADITETDKENLFTEKMEDFYLYDLEYQSESNHEEIKIKIKIPNEISHQKKVNFIRVNTYPLTSTTLENVTLIYRGIKTEVTTLNKGVDSSLKGSLKLNFESQYIQEVHITLRNSELIRLPGHKVRRVLGSNLVEVGYETVAEGTSLVLSKFNMKGIYSIEDITCYFQNRRAFSYSSVLDEELKNSIYSYQVMKMDPDKTLRVIPTGNLQNLSEKEIWVAVRLKRDPNNGVVPLLKRLDLQVKPK